MAKYHINATGRPGLCTATKRCPFGGVNDHFESREAALAEQERNWTEFYQLKSIPPLPRREAKLYADLIERKNAGERSEPIIASQILLTGKFDGKEIAEAEFSGQTYVFEGDYPDHKIFIQQPGGNRTAVNIKTAVFLDALDQISTRGPGLSEAQVLTQLGFSRKRLAKAESESKADLVLTMKTGEKYGVSIKSDLGSPPTLTGASQESRLTVAIRPAGKMTRAEFAKVLDEVAKTPLSGNKPMVPGKTMIALLQERGVVVDMDKSRFESEKYRESLQEIHPLAEVAMKDMVVSYISSTDPNPGLEDERATIFQEYATKRNTTGVVEAGKEATHFANLRVDRSLEAQKITKQLFKDGIGGAVKIEGASSKQFIHVGEERMPLLDPKETVAYFPFAISGRMK